MPLGYRGNAGWRDMSEYACHFTKATAEATARDSMFSILYSGRINATGRYGAIRWADALGDTQQSACFSEIPLDRLDRLTERRSSYGIGFKQDVLLGAGGGRVWYIDNDSPLASTLQGIMSQAVGPPMDTESWLWKLTPFIDFPGDYGDTQYRFEWEREWRVPGGLPFQPHQVAFLFIPEHDHPWARNFCAPTPDPIEAEYYGPHFRCPIIDPLWPDNRIQAALAGTLS